jgi:hypothetical protein
MSKRPSQILPDDLCDLFKLPHGTGGPTRVISADGVIQAKRGWGWQAETVAEFHNAQALLQLQEDPQPTEGKTNQTLVIFTFEYVSCGYQFQGDVMKLSIGFGDEVDSPYWPRSIEVPCYIRKLPVNFGFLADASIFGVDGRLNIYDTGMLNPIPPRCPPEHAESSG